MDITVNIKKSMIGRNRRFDLSCMFISQKGNLALLGASGSGKSLTLQAIAGLITPDSGRIVVGGRTLFDSSKGIDIAPEKRKIGYVFQDYALFPHLSVKDNIGFSLRGFLGRMSRDSRTLVDDLIDLFELGDLHDAMPGDISGGQRQRTAVARALASSPKLLLLDEPFSALDQPLRVRMRKELSRILGTIGIPAIIVTHDVADIEGIADNVVIYNHGQVQTMLRLNEMQHCSRHIQGIITEEMNQLYQSNDEACRTLLN